MKVITITITIDDGAGGRTSSELKIDRDLYDVLFITGRNQALFLEREAAPLLNEAVRKFASKVR